MESAGAPGVQAAGDVELVGVWLYDTKNNNQGYNMLGSFTDLRLYESIHSPKMHGYLALTETQNLIETMPITGHEVLTVEFKTPGLSSFKTSFVVTGIGMREHSDKHNAYSLNLISYATYKTLNASISKAFRGNTGELVKKVFFDSFGKSLTDADDADNEIAFVSPYWDPMTVINHITRLALYPNAKMRTPNYVFYETHKGHKFKSLTSLYNQKNFTTFTFDKNPARDHIVDGTSTRDINREYASALSLSFVESPCVIRDTLTGVLNTDVLSMNILSKQLSISSYNAALDFHKTTHTDSLPLSRHIASSGGGLTIIKHVYPNLFDGVGDVSNDITAKTAPLLGQLETYKINMLVHGRTDLEAGQMVFVLMKRFATVDINDTHTTEEYDKIYSGRYLITRIEHAFTQAKHQCHLELIKDSRMRNV